MYSVSHRSGRSPDIHTCRSEALAQRRAVEALAELLVPVRVQAIHTLPTRRPRPMSQLGERLDSVELRSPWSEATPVPP
jgi:hypothetical protein